MGYQLLSLLDTSGNITLVFTTNGNYALAGLRANCVSTWPHNPITFAL